MKKFLVLPVLVLFIFGCGPELKPAASVVDKVKTDQTVKAVDAPKERPDFVYESSKYNFGLRAFPQGYKVKYLSDDVGVVFEKYTVPPKNPNKKDPYENYTVQIYVTASDNVDNYKNLNDFISKKYNGYTFQFADYGSINGFYVDDTVYIQATVHFFAMNKDKSLIYDVYMKLPSKYYLFEKDAFENMIKNMVLL